MSELGCVGFRIVIRFISDCGLLYVYSLLVGIILMKHGTGILGMGFWISRTGTWRSPDRSNRVIPAGGTVTAYLPNEPEVKPD